jgi:hypothetical protein
MEFKELTMMIGDGMENGGGKREREKGAQN